MSREEKVICRTPNAEGATRLPRWKFDCVARAILDAVGDAGPDGLAFKQLTEGVKSRLSEAELKDLGSVGWHATTVKLELEVQGKIARVDGVTPQRMVLGSGR
jgi:hypothetical protein